MSDFEKELKERKENLDKTTPMETDYEYISLDKRLRTLKDNLTKLDPKGYPRNASYTLYNLIERFIQQNDRDQAKEYLDQLEELNKLGNKWTNLHYSHSLAVYLKSSNRNRYKVDAERIFVKNIAENDFDHYVLLDDIRHLVELLLYEYKTYKEEEVLREIKSYLSQMHDVAVSELIFTNLVDSLVLQSKLAVLEGDFQAGQLLLDEAIQIAQEKGLQSLLKTAEMERDNLTKEFAEMRKMIDENVTTNERIDRMSILDYLQESTKYLHEYQENQ